VVKRRQLYHLSQLIVGVNCNRVIYKYVR
jgi:hypothetical protein